MKFKKTLTALVFSLALVGAFTLVSHAVTGLQEIKAYLNADITFKLNNETQTLTDATGSPTFPITYNNTTYLPIRSIADMLGVEVGWDQATQTVLLGQQPNGVDLIDTYKAYQFDGYAPLSWAGQNQTSDGATAEIGGLTISHWLYFGTKWSGNGAAAVFNLQGKHDTLTFSYFSNADSTLTVQGDDGMVLGEYSIVGGAAPKTVTIPLFKTNELRFELAMPGSTSVSIFNAFLDAE